MMRSVENFRGTAVVRCSDENARLSVLIDCQPECLWSGFVQAGCSLIRRGLYLLEAQDNHREGKL